MQSPANRAQKLSLRPHPHLYEINTWVWLESLSRRDGRKLSLSDVPDRDWDEFARLGFDLVWLMGVWERSVIGRKIAQTEPSLFPQYDHALPGWTPDQVVGSPYSIRNYSPDPRMGSWSDLAAVREKLHARNIGLILDFVPNHTGLDHPWISDRPEYYIHGTEQQFRDSPSDFHRIERTGAQPLIVALARDPYFSPWKDLAQLNLFDPGARAALLSALQHIAQYCDGVRCDMSMLVLTDVFSKTWNKFLAGFTPPAREFWTDAAAAVPGLILMAEVYWGMEGRLQELGFDFTYCKGFYDLLRSGQPRDVRAHFTAAMDYQKRAVHFLENHDEERSAAVFGADKLPAVASLLATAPGLRFYFQGQLEGRKLRLPIQLCAAADEPLDLLTTVFYEKILQISNHPVFHEGEWKLIPIRDAGDSTAQNLIAFEWKLPADSVTPSAATDAAAPRGPAAADWKIVVINLAACPSQGFLEIVSEFSPTTNYILHEELTNSQFAWHGPDIATQGLYVRVPSYNAQILTVRSIK